MNSNIELKTEDYSIEISETCPQVINPKKSHFLFDNLNKGLPRSPRRDCMPFPLNNSSKSLSIPVPIVRKNEDKIKDPIKERIEQKLTENIKNREGFESLLQDPEINQFISK